jgi:hypothetical protein
MRSRCNNPNVRGYKLYGGRGIKVCSRWNNFANFLSDILATIGERPPDHSLDRIENSKGYFPGNVRWATRSIQMKNRRPYKHRKPNNAWMRRPRTHDGRFA